MKYCNPFVRAFSTTRAKHGANSLNLDILCKRSPPGLKSSKKLWWAKEITPDIHIAGGLTERQMKYAYDGGFESIVSLFDEKSAGKFGGEKLVTSVDAKRISKLAKFQFETVLDENVDWTTVSAVKALTETIRRIKKPALLYSNQPSAVAFATLMHLAYESKNDPKCELQVNSEKFFKMSAIMGMDFTSDKIKAVVSEITGEPVVHNPPKPNAELKNWLGFWLAHPLYKNWFTAGQIRRAHVQELESLGFKSVINMRQGMTMNGKPSQETITLLNIQDNQLTYDDDHKPLRQLDSTLKTLVIDPSLDKTYISTDSVVNYESRNFEEYGDEIGHNEEIEREHFAKESTLKYYHLPIDLYVKYSPEVFAQYKDTLLDIGRDGPVLFHCAIGKRTAFMGVLAAALQYGKNLNWAVKRINELGFEVSPTTGWTDVYDMYSGWLK